jgi:hypothetical protein
VDEHNLPKRPWEDYEEYARKMDQFVYGPTTTYFEQLIADGIELPEPDAVSDADISRKLWEVIAGLAARRVMLNYSDHLNDREMYAALWHDRLRGETPAIDEIGFTSHIDLADALDEDNGLAYFKYYADEDFRASWLETDPDFVMPPHEDPPYSRDYVLPRTPDYMPPLALEWLRAHPSAHAFATNRFPMTQDAIAFVEQLFAAGAAKVTIDNIQFLPSDDWLPYADTLMVTLPGELAKRREIFRLIDEVGRPDEDAGQLPSDEGQEIVRLWWD